MENWSKDKLVDDMYDTYILRHLQSIDLPRGVYLASRTNYEGYASTCLCMIAIAGLTQQYFPDNISIIDIVGDAHLDLQPIAPGRILYKHHTNNKEHTLRIIKINSFIGDIIN